MILQARSTISGDHGVLRQGGREREGETEGDREEDRLIILQAQCTICGDLRSFDKGRQREREGEREKERERE